MRVIRAFSGKLELKDEIEVIYEKKVSKFGTGAKIDCPKEHIGKVTYVLVKKGEAKCKKTRSK
jgi:putative transposon-encoded protein